MNENDMTKKRVNFTLEKDIVDKLETLAKQHNRSMSNYLEVIIEQEYKKVK